MGLACCREGSSATVEPEGGILVPQSYCCGKKWVTPIVEEQSTLQLDISLRRDGPLIESESSRWMNLEHLQYLRQIKELKQTCMREVVLTNYTSSSEYPLNADRNMVYACYAETLQVASLVSAIEAWVAAPDEGAGRSSMSFCIQGKCPQERVVCSSEVLRFIGETACTVVPVDPWDAPTFIRDPWCLWEMYSTMIIGNRLHFTMGSTEQARFREALRTSSEVVRQALSDFNTQDGDGTSADDTATEDAVMKRVLSEIDRGMGLHRFRERLQTRLAEYFAQCAERALSDGRIESENGFISSEHLQLQDNMARFLREQGSLENARATFNDLQSKCETSFGIDAPQTLCISNQLAVTLLKIGGKNNLAEAQRLQRHVLQRRTQTLGDAHVDTLQSMSNLAVVLSCDGEHVDPAELQEAQSLSRQALNGRRALLGKGSPTTLYTASNLGQMLSWAIKRNLARKEDVIEAEGLHAQATQGYKSKLGSWHPLTLTAQHNQAFHWLTCACSDIAVEALGADVVQVYRDPSQEILKKAKELCLSVVQYRTERIGQDHADTRESRELLYKLRGLSLESASSSSARRKSVAIDCKRCWKEMMPERFPFMNCCDHFREVRFFLKLYGAKGILRQLQEQDFADTAGNLTTGTKPFNVFARIGSGVMKQPQMDEDQELLGEYRDKFLVACNRPECDENWESTDPAWIGKASMSARHRFLVPKDLHWRWFNVLVFGMQRNLDEAIAMLRDMRAAALLYARRKDGWSSNVGLFFHVYSMNSVNALHLHVLDLDHVGPSYSMLQHRNLPLNDAIEVLDEEFAERGSETTSNGDSNGEEDEESAEEPEEVAGTGKVEEVAV